MKTPAVSLQIVSLPAQFFIWWYTEAPKNLLKILLYYFRATIHLFSFKLLFSTFFMPWKNEYREGLVRTAVFIGMLFKSILIVMDLFIFGFVIAIEAAFFVFWFLIPLLPIVFLYGTFFTR